MLGENIPNRELIRFKWPKSKQDKEAVWLLASYVKYAWTEIYEKRQAYLKKEQIFGYLKFKFKENQQGARYPMSNIPGL